MNFYENFCQNHKLSLKIRTVCVCMSVHVRACLIVYSIFVITFYCHNEYCHEFYPFIALLVGFWFAFCFFSLFIFHSSTSSAAVEKFRIVIAFVYDITMYIQAFVRLFFFLFLIPFSTAHHQYYI